MSWLEIIARTAGVLFALASVGVMGIIALFVVADREAERQKHDKRKC